MNTQQARADWVRRNGSDSGFDPYAECDAEWEAYQADQEHEYEEGVAAGYRARGQANIY